MDQLNLPLRTPKQSTRGTPIEGSEGNGCSSTLKPRVRGSPLAAFELAPRRNFEQELETRTTFIPLDLSTSKKLHFPSLSLGNQGNLSSDEEEGGEVPTFSLKRKRHNENEDTVLVPSRSAKKLVQDQTFFRPIISTQDESY